MALNQGLEPFRFERIRSALRPSLALICFWALWLVFFTTMPIPPRLSLHGTAFVLLIGCYWWTVSQGVLYLLVMSFIFASLSLTPSGFFWVSIFLVFLICKLGLSRFRLSTRYQILLAVFFIALLIELTQIFLMNRMIGLHVFSWKLLWSILYSSSIQALVGVIGARPLIVMLGAK